MQVYAAKWMILVVGLPIGLSPLRASAADVSIHDVAEVCSGPIVKGEVVGGRGKIGDSGYEFEVTADKKFNLYRSGKLISSNEKFTYDQYSSCLTNLTQMILAAPKAKPCRLKANGVDRYQKEYDVSRQSGNMGGGFGQPQWCNQAIGVLQGELPDGSFSIISSSESTSNHCAPFNCPQYNYTCNIHVKSDPLYNLKDSDQCPR